MIKYHFICNNQGYRITSSPRSLMCVYCEHYFIFFLFISGSFDCLPRSLFCQWLLGRTDEDNSLSYWNSQAKWKKWYIKMDIFWQIFGKLLQLLLWSELDRENKIGKEITFIHVRLQLDLPVILTLYSVTESPCPYRYNIGGSSGISSPWLTTNISTLESQWLLKSSINTQLLMMRDYRQYFERLLGRKFGANFHTNNRLPPLDLQCCSSELNWRCTGVLEAPPGDFDFN